MDLLNLLIEQRHRTVAKAELLDLAWPGQAIEPNNLAVQMWMLRRVRGAQAIATVPGRGYRFQRFLVARQFDPMGVVRQVLAQTEPGGLQHVDSQICWINQSRRAGAGPVHGCGWQCCPQARDERRQQPPTHGSMDGSSARFRMAGCRIGAKDQPALVATAAVGSVRPARGCITMTPARCSDSPGTGSPGRSTASPRPIAGGCRGSLPPRGHRPRPSGN